PGLCEAQFRQARPGGGKAIRGRGGEAGTVLALCARHPHAPDSGKNKVRVEMSCALRFVRIISFGGTLMRQTEIFLAGFLLFVGLGLSVGAAHQRAASSGTDSVQEELITLERSALDRWIRLDPEGYLALYDSQITYFDPYAENRVDGLEALQA